jgi:hypothetical protein
MFRERCARRYKQQTSRIVEARARSLVGRPAGNVN